MTDLPKTREEALAFLDARIDQGVKPGLERIEGLTDFLADPQSQYPVIHIAGTNGKTTVTRMVDGILGAHGLRTGATTSPHLHRIEERFMLDGKAIDAGRFVEAVRDVAWVTEEYESRSGEGVTYFELTIAIALSLFADAAVDVAVVEVGMGGRWDATNVVRAAVSCITGISFDHMSHLGTSLGAIAAEKAAILKPGGMLVTGPLPAAAEGAVTARVAETGARWFRFGEDFAADEARRAVGGWQATVRGIHGTYPDLYLPLHGRHQVDHLATSIAVCETFLERRLDPELVAAAAAATTSPGRLEVISRSPLVLVDGAHNEEGFRGLAAALDDEFPHIDWQLVVGVRGDRVIEELVAPLRGKVARVWACAADDPASIPAAEVGDRVGATLGVPHVALPSVAEALDAATTAAGEDGGVVVAGSLYAVGEARTSLVGEEVRPSGVHVRYQVEEAEAPSGLDDQWDDVEE